MGGEDAQSLAEAERVLCSSVRQDVQSFHVVEYFTSLP